MSNSTVRIQIRRDTAADWTSANPVLAQGEQGLETDTGYCKIGDGVTAWVSLAYSVMSPSVENASSAYASGVLPSTSQPNASAAAVTGDVMMVDGNGKLSPYRPRTDWPLAGWPFRKKLTIANSLVPSDVAGFHLGVNVGADPDVAQHGLPDRRDVRFTDQNGNPLAHTWHDPDPSSLLPDAIWCWFQENRAVYYHGTNRRLYVGFQNTNGDIGIASYDLDSQLVSTFILHTALEYEDHDDPAVLIRHDGRIVVAYCAHGGLEMYVRISSNPEDITAWGAEASGPTNTGSGTSGFTYSNLFQLSGESGTIYLFWRSNGAQPAYSTSSDGGITWSSATAIFTSGSNSVRPYVKFASNGVNRIDIFLTDGHPRDITLNNCWHLYYEAGNLYQSNGTLICSLASVAGSPITTTQCTEVYNASEAGCAWVWSIAENDGMPVVTFATMPAPYTDHRYWYGRWTGTTWALSELCSGGAWFLDQPFDMSDTGPGECQYSGGVTINPDNPSIVYVARYVGSQSNGNNLVQQTANWPAATGQFEIEKWTTADDGQTWQTQRITESSDKKNIRPYSPVGLTNAGGPEVLWLNGDYQYFEGEFQMQLKCYPQLPGFPAPAHARIYIPTTVSSEAPTSIYMYFGNPKAPHRRQRTFLPSTHILAAMMAPLSPAYAVRNEIDQQFNSVNDQGFAALALGEQSGGAVPTFENNGPFGWSANFAGTGFLRVNAGLDLHGLAALTVSAWVFISSVDSNNDVIMSNWNTPLNGARLLFRRGVDGHLQFYVITASGSPGTQIGGSFTDLTFTRNAWHHVAATFSEAAGVTGYVDGVASAVTFANTEGAPLHGTFSAVPFQLGGGYYDSPSTRQMEGQIADARIITAAKDAAAIAAEVNNLNEYSTFLTSGFMEGY